MIIKIIKIIIFISIIVMLSFSFAQNSRAAINKQFNYQGKLTNSSSVAVADGAYDMAFKLYTVAGGGSASWTESWTNAALFTNSSTTFTNDGCAAGIDKMAYTPDGNEATLAAGQALWNTAKKVSAVIQSVDTTGVGGFVCIYDDPYTTWATSDEITNRIYVKNGLFSVMLGTITAQTVDFTAATYYLGVTIGADAEMVPRKRIGAVPQAWNANNVVGDGYVDIDNTSTAQDAVNINYNPASGTYDAMDITYGSGGGTGNALTVTQNGAGAIVNLTNTASAASAAFTLTNLGSGNSLVVNDAASDTTPFIIDASGNVGIGTTVPVSALDVRGTIENGLVAWWPMDEGSGSTAVDYSINNKNGTITGSSCPSGYILVPENATYGTSNFCVMQYEAKNVGGVATSQAASTPWVSITQTAAATACTNAGGHLITNNEWMTIARNVEQAAGNWTLGSVGSGYLFAGHNDNAPAAAKEASATNTGNYRCAYTDAAGTTEAPSPCPTNTAAGASGTAGNQVRVLTLSNGNVIWDIAGNVWEWTNNTISCAAAQCTTAEMPYDVTPASEWIEFTAINTYGQLSYDQIRPSNSAWNAAQGMGRLYTDFDAASPSGNVHAFERGGNWGDTSYVGAFALSLFSAPADSGAPVGFRCVR